MKTNIRRKIRITFIILKLICMRIACAFLCATSRYFMESSGMYETTGNNTRDASWVSVETLSVEYMNQDHFF